LPIDRDRRRAKRRYTRRQAAQAARAAARRRRLQILGAVVAVVVLAAGIYGISRLAGAGESTGSTSGTATQQTAWHGSQALSPTVTAGHHRTRAAAP
jgi:peptidyl-prolyl cis-trans isomerase B (cyclophilin B)